VKAGVAVCTTFAAVIGIYIGVDAWADDKAMAAQLETLKVVAEAQVRNDMDHDKMVQSSRISRSETNITVTEMKLEQLEEDIDERQDAGREPTARQERSLTRLTKLLETYESEQLDATTKLTTITTITTTESN
jgi:predicted RNA-binding protein